MKQLGDFVSSALSIEIGEYWGGELAGIETPYLSDDPVHDRTTASPVSTVVEIIAL